MGPIWRSAYIALGSNLEHPQLRVAEAFSRLESLPGTRVELRSPLYLSRPLGPQDQPDFVNAVAGVLTQLGPRDLLEALLDIERAMGRIRLQRWGPRIVDLDLVWLTGAAMDEPGLTLPHPGVSDRNFVLYPLCDIAPQLRIPGLGRVADLKSRVNGGGISVLPPS
jgi:2-amino-4-hydroxy-6-hydroxymethyldihydropteridine diphosphokinase